MKQRSWTIAAIVVGHFTAAFSALGMPPFFPLIFARSLHSDADYLIGWAYVLPAAMTALSAPMWGRLSDRFGKKTLLLRAQFGLAGSFLLAGYAESVPVFLLALALQGLFGGTFAASSAYLATMVDGKGLTRTLTLLQGSARAALFVAPVGLGFALLQTTPIETYRYLALLPLAAALLIAFLPAPETDPAAKSHSISSKSASSGSAPSELWTLVLIQFAFAFGTVVTFPYFVPFVDTHLGGADSALTGMLFGLPHLVYLLAAAPLSLWLGQKHLDATVSAAFLLLAASLCGQLFANTLLSLTLWRLVMGVAMTAGFIGLHGMIASASRSSNAGRTFGWLDAASKWGGVAAGVIAGLAVEAFGTNAPLVLGALVLAAAAIALASRASIPLLQAQ